MAGGLTVFRCLQLLGSVEALPVLCSAWPVPGLSFWSVLGNNVPLCLTPTPQVQGEGDAAF